MSSSGPSAFVRRSRKRSLPFGDMLKHYGRLAASVPGTQLASKRVVMSDTLQRYAEHRLRRDAVLFVPEPDSTQSRRARSALWMDASPRISRSPSAVDTSDAFAAGILRAGASGVLEVESKLRSIDERLHAIDLQFERLKLAEYQRTDQYTPSTVEPEQEPDLKPEPEPVPGPELPLVLTPEEEQRVGAFFSQKLRHDAVVVKAHRISLTFSEFCNLRPGKWLDDHVIDMYLAELTTPLVDVFCFSSLFMTTLKEFGLQKGMKRRLKGFKSVFEPRVVLVPLHVHGNHWTLAVINNADKSIRYFDSMRSSRSSGSSELEILQKFLGIQSENLGQPPEQYEVIDNCDCPQQANGSDCGVFMCAAAVCIAYKRSLSYSQREMPMLRKRMALTLINLQ